MKHIYFEFDGYHYYIEINKQRYAVRQMIKEPDGRMVLSSKENALAESVVSVDETDTIIPVEKFDKIWSAEMKKYDDEWKEIKKNYPLGKKVVAEVKYFYPQGIISDLDGILGVTVDDAYSADDVMLYPGDVLDGFVCGYDEENMWVKFSSVKE